MEGTDDKLINTFSRLRRSYLWRKEYEISAKVLPSEKKSDSAVFFFHGWGSSSSTFSFLAGKLREKHSIVLFDYPIHAVSDDTKKTIHYFNEIAHKATAVIKQMKKIGITDFHFIGVSLGGYLSLFTARLAKKDVKKIIICCSGSRLSDTFWVSIAGEDLKKRLISKGYGLARLRREWKSLEPVNNLPPPETKVMFFMSKKDMLVPYNLQEELLSSFRGKNIACLTNVNTRFGHYLTIASMLTGIRTIGDFIEKC